MLPLVGRAPDQPPDAVQDWASSALHFNVVALPFVTVVLLAVKVTCGIVGVPVLDVALEGEEVVESLADEPHAASTETAAPMISQEASRVTRLRCDNFASCANRVLRRASLNSKLVLRLPSSIHRLLDFSASTVTAEKNLTALELQWGGMIVAINVNANLSQIAEKPHRRCKELPAIHNPE